jgi:hypothetical protein
MLRVLGDIVKLENMAQGRNGVFGKIETVQRVPKM